MPKSRKKGRSEKGKGTLVMRGSYWYFRITIDGKEFTHPTRTADWEEAKQERDRFLRTLRPILPAALKPLHEIVTVAELVDDYVDFLIANRSKSVEDIERALLVNVLPAQMFQGRLAASITTQDLQNYRDFRKSMGRKDATINNELSYLRAAFKHGMKRQTPKKVLEVPYFPIVDPKNVRLGFIDVATYGKILGLMCDSLKLFFVLAYHSGCRSGELKNLKWSQVYRRPDGNGFIELEPGTTKNNEGRNLPIYGDMEEWLDKQLAVRNAQCPECEYVLFWHEADVNGLVMRQAGDKLDAFQAMWKRAVTAAGFPKLIPHDLRRSAVTNMTQVLSIPEIMNIIGHKTMAMFIRYNIVSRKGITEAGKKMTAWMKQVSEPAAREANRQVVLGPW
jgi:integrase